MLYKRFMALADRGHTDTQTHTHTQSKYYNPPSHAHRALMRAGAKQHGNLSPKSGKEKEQMDNQDIFSGYNFPSWIICNTGNALCCELECSHGGHDKYSSVAFHG